MHHSSDRPPQATREGLGHHDIDTAPTAAITRGSTAASKLAEEDVKDAALHCVALDDSGEFLANRVLGLFEVAPLRTGTPPAGKLGISKAEVEFVVRRRHEDEDVHDSGGDGGGAGGSDAGRGAVGVNILLEVALVESVSSPGLEQAETAAEVGDNSENVNGTSNGIGGRAHSSAETGGGRGGGGGDLGLTFGVSDAYHAPTRGDVEAAAVAAAATVTDSAGAQAAISALACWNLMMTTWEAGLPAVHVEVVVAFGHRGDWYTVNKTIALTRSALQAASSEPGAPPPSSSSGSSGDHGNHETVLLTASFDWQPTADVWPKLGGPAVADVKVYDAADAGVADGVSVAGLLSSPPVQPLLQATLCKRAEEGGAGAEGGTSAVRTDVTPYTEQRVSARRTAYDTTSSGVSSGGGSSTSTSTGGNPGVQTQPEFASVVRSEFAAGIGFATSRPWVISEIEDREWWANREEEERGKGMDAVHALPRLPGWKPGQWKIRHQRRRRQAQEKERRRAAEAASRRESAGTKTGGGIFPTDMWGVVKGAWRTTKREWRRARRRVFGRRNKK